MFDLHVPCEVPLEGELAGAVETLEGLAVRVQVHVAHQVVHAVELLPTQLGTERGEEQSPNTHHTTGLLLASTDYCCGEVVGATGESTVLE